MAGEPGHPSSWRLHRAHPALGLEELEGELLWPPKPYELGVRWLALDPVERRLRERDFAAAVRAAASRESGWEVEVVEEDGLLGVRMDRWKAPALQAKLLDHVGERARRREEAMPRADLEVRRSGELDRTVRAHARIALSRLGRRPVTAVVTAIAVLTQLADWLT